MVCPPSPGSCLPLSPLVSPCLPLSPRWMVCPPSRGSCLPFSPPVPLLVSLCWMVCPPSRGSSLPFCLPLSPLVPLLVSLCWISPFPRVLSPLVSPCLPLSHFLFPKQCAVRGSQCFLKVSALVLDGVSAFPRVLSPIVPVVVPFCWMVCPPSRGSCLPLSALLSPLVSNCTPFCFPLLDVPLPEGLVSPCLPSSPFLFPKQCTVRGS